MNRALGISQRWVSSGTAVLLAALLALQSACSSSTPDPNPKILPVTTSLADVSGALLYLDVTNVVSFQFKAPGVKPVTRFPEGSYPGGLAASPDGSLVAYSLYQPSKDGRSPGGTNLNVMRPDGTGQRLVLAYALPGEALVNASWTADGERLYFSRWSPQGTQRIERVNLDGSGRRVMVESAHSPALAPQGDLAYIAPDPVSRREALWITSGEGATPRRLFNETDFDIFAAPRFSPDGTRIAFVAVGGPEAAPPPSGSVPAPKRGGGGLEPPIAEAHGVPWDLWIINRDGSGLRRLTDLGEDGPMPAWSPDGRWIALGAELGLYLVQPDTGEVRRILEQPAWGGITWIR